MWLTRGETTTASKKKSGVHQFINAYDIAPDGTASNGRLFANMHSAEDGVPDGMKVDVGKLARDDGVVAPRVSS